MNERPRVQTFLLLSVLVGCLSSVVWAEPTRFEHLSTREGLPSDSVYEVLQGDEGYLWVVTEDGFVRFDGERLRIYEHDPDDPGSLATNDLNSIAQDDEGFLWIGTWGAGLERFDPRTETFTHYRHDRDDPGSLSGFRVQTIIQTTDGDLWVGTYRSGLNRLPREHFGRETGHFVHLRHDPEDPASLPHDHVWSIYEDAAQRLFVGTNHGLAVMDRETGTFRVFYHDPDDPDSLSHSRVRSVNGDRQGRIWLSTEGGLDVLDPVSGVIRRVLGSEGSPAGSDFRTFKVVTHGRDGGFWIGTRDRGLMRFDLETEQLEIFEHRPEDPFSLARNDVRGLHEDRAGNLWIATRGGGLDRIDLKPRKFTHYRHDPDDPDSLLHDRVLALLEDDGDHIWIGHGSGLDRLDRGQGRFEHYRHDPDDAASLAPGSVRALLEDRRGHLWVGTDNGLERLAPGGSGFVHYRARSDDPRSLSHDEILALYEDRAGDLWIGTDGGGLNRFDTAAEQFFVFRHDPGDPDSLSFDRVSTIQEGPEGELWVGSDGGGLDRLSPNRAGFVHFRHDPEDATSLPSDNVFSLFLDSSDGLWVATQGGLARFEPGDGTFEVYDAEDGLPSDLVASILEDSEGSLWLATGRGIARLARDGSIERFGIDDGLEGLAFNERAATRGSDGTLYFGGTQGLDIVHPAHLSRNVYRPRVVVSELQAPGQRSLPAVPWTLESLDLEHPIPLLTLELAALDFTAPAANRYALKRAEEEPWRPLDAPRVVLTDLSPGQHTVFFRGSNNDGDWSSPRRLDLVVRRPFWRSAPFGLGLALCTAVLLLGVHRHRLRSLDHRRAASEDRVRRLESQLDTLRDDFAALRSETQQLVYALSHDLRSPLFTAQGFLGELGTSIATLRGQLEPAIDQLSEVARSKVEKAFDDELPTALRFLTESMRSMHGLTGAYFELAGLTGTEPELRPVPVREVVDGILADLAEAIESTDARFEIGELPTLVTDRDLLAKILEPMIRNALDYRHPERPCVVQIAAHTAAEATVLSVHDNGIGIEADDLPRVFDTLRRIGGRKTPGSGMGLAISRTAARHLGGRLTCDSVAGSGSTFRLVLPATSAADGDGVG